MQDLIPVLVSSLERAPWGWSLLAVVVVAVVKAWPIIQLQATNAKQALRKEHRDDLHDCQERLDAMDGKIATMVTHIHQLDMKIFGTVAAYRMLHDGVTITNPEHPALSQARAMFQTTWDGPVDAAEGMLTP